MTVQRTYSRRSFVKGAALVGATALAGGLAGCADSHVIVDDTGREVKLPTPNNLESIYFTSPLAQIFCFTVAPDLIAGTSMRFTKDQLDYLPDGTGQLTYMGTLSSGGSIDLQALEYNGVQAVFSMSGTDLTDVNIDQALRLEEQTGIPVVLIDGSFDVIGDSYRKLGECLGRPARANQLADYCEDVYRRVRSAVSAVPNDQRVTYYFAEGPQGLQTEPNASQHSLAFTKAGGVNVAANLDYLPGSFLMTDATIDQIRDWDPQFIITWDRASRLGASLDIASNAEWAGIDAVKNGRVFEMPSLPFAFCDRPPGMNRFLGLQWLANLFYPDRYDVDMIDVVREFYSVCYWRDISRDQARDILGESYEYVLRERG